MADHNAFERNLSDLRDRSVFTFASDDVERISVTGGEGREVILVRENGTWRRVANPRMAEWKHTW